MPECAAESSVLQDSAYATTANEQAHDVGLPAGFIQRSQPKTLPICRKIRKLQQEKWGPKAELTLKPHRCAVSCSPAVLQKTDPAAVPPR
jgi:hypothetical protein